MTHTAAPTLVGVLRAGLAWLYDTPQPDDAVLTHHGETAPAVGNRQLSFTPRGWNGHPVIVFNVADWTWANDDRPDAGLAAGEMHRLAAIVGSFDHRVARAWNGKQGAVTGSLALARPAHMTLRAAVGRYLAGCPRHGSVFCHANTPPCTWSRDGHARIVRPTWPEETR